MIGDLTQHRLAVGGELARLAASRRSDRVKALAGDALVAVEEAIELVQPGADFADALAR